MAVKCNWNNAPEITKEVITYRNLHHMTQMELANYIGVSIDVIINIEKMVINTYQGRSMNVTPAAIRLIRETIEVVNPVTKETTVATKKTENIAVKNKTEDLMLEELQRHPTFEISGVALADMKYDSESKLFTVSDKLCRIYLGYMYKALLDNEYKKSLERSIRMGL